MYICTSIYIYIYIWGPYGTTSSNYSDPDVKLPVWPVLGSDEVLQGFLALLCPLTLAWAFRV